MPAAGGHAGTIAIVAVATATLVALGGWMWDAVRHRRRATAGPSERWDRAFERIAVPIVVVGSIAAVPIAPVAGVFSVVVALNFLLGRAENVPFSRYPMFARPGRRAWTLRFEDSSGARVNIGSLGILAPTAKKRLHAEVRAAQAKDKNIAEARESAAALLAEWINQRRPPAGPLASEPITIVLLEYEFDGSVIVPRRRVLAVAQAQ